jgi:gliding motility-associated-like protein
MNLILRLYNQRSSFGETFGHLRYYFLPIPDFAISPKYPKFVIKCPSQGSIDLLHCHKRMKVIKKFLSFFMVVCFTLLSLNSFASHIYGGELLYQNLSGNTYRVSLTLYGNGTGYFDTLQLKPDTLELEVSPVCPSQLGNTTCHAGGTLPGVKKFVYSDTITLSGPSAAWRFVFAGELSISGAGRSSQITNISGNSSMQLDAKLNNVSGPNNSPLYSTIPTPFYCIGIDQQYNQGALDADGDSLSFNLVAGVNASPGNPLFAGSVSYAFPFTAAAPLSTVPGSFSFNKINGELAFTPDIVQDGLVVDEVLEYRHGVLVGTSKREMTFIVTDNCNGTPPSLQINNISGGGVAPKNVIDVCAGTALLTFDIVLNNPDGDNTEIATTSIPDGAIVNINHNNTPAPSLNFTWPTAAISSGNYSFYVYVKNNHCPLVNRQTVGYTISFVPVPTIDQALISPNGCTHQGLMEYNLALGYLPRIVTVTEGGVTVRTYTDSTGTIIDSLPRGNYVAYVSSNPLCSASSSFDINDSGTLLVDPVNRSYCLGDTTGPIILPLPGPGTTVTWLDANNNVLPGAPTPNTAIAGTTNWFITEHYKVCTSDETPVTAVVHALPDIKILTKPESICYGDTLYLEATGGTTYIWSPADRIGTADNGKLYTRLVRSGLFTVKVTNEFNCVDSSSIFYDNVKPCCSFYYPNAFTPDGAHNTGFKVLTYGNMWDYRLAVFNRWGQRVFLSVDPQEYWDGRFGGVPCETGTYYYYFSGRCLTGITEEKKGDVTLVR